MSVKIAKNLKRERTFINANGEEIKEEQFFGGNVRPDLGKHPGTAGAKPEEDTKGE